MLDKDTQSRKYMIIGITGPLGSGKGTVADAFEEIAQSNDIVVRRHSLSDEIREEISRRGSQAQRVQLKEVADRFRQNLGSGIWATLTGSKIKDYLLIEHLDSVLFIVDGIRSPGEVNMLRAMFGNKFHLLGVTATPANIYTYLQQRNREDEPKQILTDQRKLEQMLKSEMGQAEQRDHGHNVAACLEMVDWPVIHNDSDRQHLLDTVRNIAEHFILSYFNL